MENSNTLPKIEVGDTVIFRTDLEAWKGYGQVQLREVMLDIILRKEKHTVASFETDLNAFTLTGEKEYYYDLEMVAQVIKPTKERMYALCELKKAIEFGCQQGHDRGHINLIEELRFIESLNK